MNFTRGQTRSGSSFADSGVPDEATHFGCARFPSDSSHSRETHESGVVGVMG
ncbi:MAG: hypothetical protein PHF57_13435 [Methanoregula sp.]|nr:hypothetical protein [Methanoregula sp.]